MSVSQQPNNPSNTNNTNEEELLNSLSKRSKEIKEKSEKFLMDISFTSSESETEEKNLPSQLKSKSLFLEVSGKL